MRTTHVTAEASNAVPAAIGTDFAESHALSAQMITLPVYPELGPKEQEEITRVLGQALPR